MPLPPSPALPQERACTRCDFMETCGTKDPVTFNYTCGDFNVDGISDFAKAPYPATGYTTGPDYMPAEGQVYFGVADGAGNKCSNKTYSAGCAAAGEPLRSTLPPRHSAVGRSSPDKPRALAGRSLLQGDGALGSGHGAEYPSRAALRGTDRHLSLEREGLQSGGRRPDRNRNRLHGIVLCLLRSAPCPPPVSYRAHKTVERAAR